MGSDFLAPHSPLPIFFVVSAASQRDIIDSSEKFKDATLYGTGGGELLA